jgi:GMP synthase (glutamine-hydrolysing) A subunit
MSDRILIIDFGSQVTQLIARRVRESGVYCEIHPFNKVTEASLKAFDPQGIILSGGPSSVADIGSPRAADAVFACGLPVLGICYGQQTLCEQLGGKVEPGDHREFGRAYVDIVDDCALFSGVWAKGGREQVWMSHGDRVTSLPAGFRVVATSEGAPFAAIANDERRIYGVQFHPEVVHTPHGAQLLKNFTHAVAGCRGDWTMAAFRQQEVRKVREQVRLSASYVGDKLTVSKASRANLSAAIMTPSRGLLLSKFSTDALIAGEKVSWLKPPPVPPLGIRVKVKPDGAAKRVAGDSETTGQPFYLVLKNSGALGIAARRQSAGNRGGKLKVFHGPSLSQVFDEVRQEVLPEAGSELTAQLLDAMRYLLVKQYPPEAD